MECTVQNLEYAVNVFYNGEQNERAKAHTWLAEAQKLPEAWNFVWELLQPTKGTEVQFYAATTLHTKILRCWLELPPETHEELKNKILQSVITYANGPKIVTNRLCTSLAAFILQQGTVDLAPILSPLSTVANSSLLLEVLTVLPEEYNSMTMGEVLRKKNRAALHQASPMVIDDMLKIFQSVYNDYSTGPPSDDIMNSWAIAAGCVTSWLSLGSEYSIESPLTLPDRMPIMRALQAAVHILYRTNDVVSGVALEACEACLSAIRIAATHGCSYNQHPTTSAQILDDVSSLVAPVIAAHNVPDSVNEELVCAMITCCVSVAECHVTTLYKSVVASSGIHLMLRVLLDVQAAPGYYPLHETRSNLMFGFWYTLQDEILNHPDPMNNMNPIWKEIFTQVLLALMTKSEMPPESEMTKDDQELLRCYRQDIADAVMYCFTFIGPRCWSIVARSFETAEKDSRREAVLHVLTSMADVVQSAPIPTPLPNMLRRTLHFIAQTHDKRILETALECIGAYANWINAIDQQDEVFRNNGTDGGPLSIQCVRAAGTALSRNPAAAALALRRLSTYCSKAASAMVHDIVQAALNPEGVSDAWVRRQLTSAAGAALAACDYSVALPLLLQIAEHIAADISVQMPEGGCVAADCAAALVNALSTQKPLALEFVRALMPSLAALTRHPVLAESMFQILKNTVTTLGNECIPLMDGISQLIIAGFNTEPTGSGIDLVKLTVVMVDEFEHTQAILSTCVCAALRAFLPDETGAVKTTHADLPDYVFSMLQLLTRKKAIYMDWIEHLIPDLVQYACQCIRQWDPEMSRNAIRWLSILALNRPNAIRHCGADIVYNVLRCIGGLAPRVQVEPFANLLLSFNSAEWGPGQLGVWMRQALNQDGFPTHHATPAHKQKFLSVILKERNHKRRVLVAVTEFSLICRGLENTEYARNSIAAKEMFF
ncbi:unnamed protein product [Leptosia nina]|uniref:Importin N-terminal domain-containing protein n=1 Tax=Leptosia nina TaxID=320188 RepID=A0AAV1JX58_9NEOP